MKPTNVFLDHDHVGALQRLRGCSYDEAIKELMGLPPGTTYYSYLDKVSREISEELKKNKAMTIENDLLHAKNTIDALRRENETLRADLDEIARLLGIDSVTDTSRIVRAVRGALNQLCRAETGGGNG